MDVTEIDALPNPARPALAAVMVQTIAVTVTERALELRAGRPTDPSRAAVEAHDYIKEAAARVRPTHEDDETPDSWHRRGVADGILAAWQNLRHAPPTDIAVSDIELYMAGFAHASSVVIRVCQEARRGR
jgi:hypothetical protein